MRGDRALSGWDSSAGQDIKHSKRDVRLTIAIANLNRDPTSARRTT